MKTAIYPGSFDPITFGHLDIIRRAADIFDKVVVCVMINSEKKTMFTIEERMDLISRVIGDFPNVEVDTWNGLLAEYAMNYQDAVIIKGLRAISDFESEFQMAIINKKINPYLETLFLSASEQYTYLSSSAVKEMAKYGADLSEFVPEEIIDDVIRKSQMRR
ncbi:MAG TPA: pantetheine-phosphate adenylyltransferase [Clostridiales bacterium]|jgi:pantetheine-phosphate adenylyltransferase|nr:pantetheine-phosphate adenylyltransferase [Clostridiales bacterium]